jgi:hypothetical protein
VDVAGDPEDELLGSEGFGVEVVRGPEDGHEQLGSHRHRAARPVIDRDGLAGVVDEKLLPGPVHLAHDDVGAAAPRLVEVGELAVAVAVGVNLSVLEPEQLEGDRLLAQLGVDVAPVRRRPGGSRRRRGREERRFDSGVVEALG